MSRTRMSTLALAGGALAAVALLAVATGDARAVDAHASAATPVAEGDGPDGERIFMKECKKCHGKTGRGDTRMGKKYEVPDMTTSEWQAKHPEEKIVKIVTEGVEDTKMDPFAEELSKEEIEAVAAFVKTLGS